MSPDKSVVSKADLDARSSPRPVHHLVLSVALALAATTSCATSADGTYAHLDEHVPDSAAYRLRYLAPPWRIFEADGDQVRLVIDSNVRRFEGEPGDVAKYDLTVDVVSGRPQALARVERDAALGAGEELVEELRAVVTDAGDEGVEVLLHRETAPARHRRYAYFDVGGGRSVMFRLDATPTVNDAEVDEMLFAFELAPELEE